MLLPKKAGAFLFGALLCPGHANPGQVISLIHTAAQQHPLVQQAKHAQAEAGFALDAARWQYFPSFSLNSQTPQHRQSETTLGEETRMGEQSFYRVKIVLPSQRPRSKTGEAISLQPGMTAQVEILTGRQSVLRYLVKPIVKTLGESLGER